MCGMNEYEQSAVRNERGKTKQGSVIRKREEEGEVCYCYVS